MRKGAVFCLWGSLKDNFCSLLRLKNGGTRREFCTDFSFYSNYSWRICRKRQSEGGRQGAWAINNGLCLQLGLMSRCAPSGEKQQQENRMVSSLWENIRLSGLDRGWSYTNKQVVAQSWDCNFLHVCCLMEGKLRPERNLGMYCTTSHTTKFIKSKGLLGLYSRY